MARTVSLGSRLGILAIVLTAPLFGGTVVVGPELPLSTTPIAAPHAVSRYAVASNGSTALAVWTDYRSGESDVFAARIDAKGNLLDPASIQLTPTPEVESSPLVTWGSDSFAVVWTNDAGSGPNVWMELVGDDGRIVQAPFGIGRGELEDIASSFGVVAVAVNVNGTHKVFLVDRDLHVSQIALTANGIEPKLVATTSGFAAAWVSSFGNTEDVHIARFSPYGAFDQTDTIATTLPQFFAPVSVAARGDDLYIATRGTQFFLMRVPRRQNTQLIATIPAPSPFATFAGFTVTDSGFVTEVIDIKANRTVSWTLSPSGTLLDSKEISATANDILAAVTLGGRHYVFNLPLFSPPAYLYGRFADDDAAKRVISQAAATQIDPAVASDGVRLLIVWNETDGSSTKVRGLLVTREGTPAGAPFEIFAGAQYVSTPAAIFANGEYLVARLERGPNDLLRRLVATHVSRDGVPRGDRVVVSDTATFSSEVSLTTDGTNVGILYDGGYEPEPTGKMGFLTPAGLAPLTPDFGFAGRVSMAWNGSIYAAAMPGIWIARVERDGTFTWKDSLPSIWAEETGIASDGDGFLVVYVNAGLGFADESVNAIALDRNAKQVGNPIVVRASGDDTPHYLDRPKIAWNGGSYDVGWVGLNIHRFPSAYTMRVSRDGHPLSSLVQIPGGGNPSILGLRGGESVIAYSRVVPELVGSRRVFLRFIRPSRDRAAAH
jgi:hypothetical protein